MGDIHCWAVRGAPSCFGSNFDNMRPLELTWKRRKRWTPLRVSPGPLAFRSLDPCSHGNTCCFPALAWAPRIKLMTSSAVVSTLIGSAALAAGRHEEPKTIRAERDLLACPPSTFHNLFHTRCGGTALMLFWRGKKILRSHPFRKMPVLSEFLQCRTSQIY